MKKCLLLDFDGVISRNSTADIMNATYAFISEFKDINRILFDELFKALVPFPLFESVNFFMSSIGLEDKKELLLSKIKTITHDTSEFESLTAEWSELGFTIKIYSSSRYYNNGNTPFKSPYKNDLFIQTDSHSKIDPNSFRNIAADLDISPKNIIYVDDCPMAVCSAKSIGIHAVMLINNVFTMNDFKKTLNYNCQSITSLSQLTPLLLANKH
jgi:beta-phosphoglucomutase-like phosphatase (HAD superfamily)